MNGEWKELTVKDVKNLTSEEINETDMQGQTRLHYAVKEEKFEVVKALTKKGINIGARSSGGWTAFFFTAWNEKPQITKHLIKEGAIVNDFAVADGGWTPLHEWAQNGKNLAVGQCYIDAEADLNKKDDAWKAPLFYAEEFNENTAIANFLKEKNAMRGRIDKLLGNTK